MVDIPQVSFGAGILSPAVHNRIDLAKFSSGMANCNNFLVHAEGGISKRPGLEFVATITKASEKTRLIPFRFNEMQTYVLEFGERYFKIYQDGGLLLENPKNVANISVTSQVTITVNNHGYSNDDHVFLYGIEWELVTDNKFYTINNVTANTFDIVVDNASLYTNFLGTGNVARVLVVETPYLGNEIDRLKYKQSNDIIYVTHPNHKPQEIGRFGLSDWRIREIDFKPQHTYPLNVSCSASTTGSTTYKYQVTAIADETEEESLVGLGSSYGINNITKANPAVVTTSSSHNFVNGEIVHIKNIVGMVELNDRRFKINNVSSYSFSLVNEDSTAYSNYISNGTVLATYCSLTNGHNEPNNNISWSTVDNSARYNIYKEQNGLYGWIGSTELTNFVDKNMEPDLRDTPPKWRQPFSQYNNYPSVVGLHEQRSIWANTNSKPLNVWLSQSSQFENMNVSNPTRDTDAVTLRLVTGQGNEIRHLMSFSDRLMIFTSGSIWSLRPGGDVDAITPASKKLQLEESLPCTDVKPIIIKNNILIVSGTNSKGFEVHSLGLQQQMDVYSGSDLTVLARHLFEDNTIQEWAYAHSPYRLLCCIRDDGKAIVMSYLNEQQIYAWTVWSTAGTFESVCVVEENQRDVFYFVVKREINNKIVKNVERLSSGKFKKSEDVFYVDSGLKLDLTDPKPILNITQGNPVVVTVNSHGYQNNDIIYIYGLTGSDEINYNQYVIKGVTTNTFELQKVNGTTHIAYVSGGFTQKRIQTVYGLGHLEGKEVTVLADGNIEIQTVNNGVIVTDNAASKFSIGLKYDANVQSLPLNAAVQTLSKKKIVKTVSLNFKNTRGVFVGPNEKNLEEYPSRSIEAWDEPASLINDTIEIPIKGNWDKDTQIYIKSEPGLPMSLLGWNANTEVS